MSLNHSSGDEDLLKCTVAMHFSKNSEKLSGYLWKLKIKIFEIHLFHVKAIVLQVPDMNC
jgi:hypothetical protein